MHPIEIVINTFIVLVAIQIWTMIGYGLLALLEDCYEATDSELLTCFFWPVILLSWVNIKLNEQLDNIL